MEEEAERGMNSNERKRLRLQQIRRSYHLVIDSRILSNEE